MRTLIPDTMLDAAVEGWDYERSEARFRGFNFSIREGLRQALLCGLGLMSIKTAGRVSGSPEVGRIREIDKAVETLDEMRAHLLLERYRLSDALDERLKATK
ncbi:hypothetical protein CcrColossus_gp423 [Caulobacter phage CcrColossus]|uniref:Uncharacterized protein n=1 Tax=Caulobacter phage CcrColossus TaxID=1211640 RepID=K4JWK9_9CAUD|nr:hypothetical protein CcrColossus_gp423 [Caulobacter phage CcrColossus]AFU88293.1 hypothetical protein CcrColossus_gp423 [Caulobacter phage CcrColossus]